MKAKYTPFDSTWSLASILGMFVSLLYVMPEISLSWGFAFFIVFLVMFISSMVTMTKADTSPDSIDSLAIKKLKKK